MLKKTLMTAAVALAITTGATTISTPEANAHYGDYLKVHAHSGLHNTSSRYYGKNEFLN